MFGYVWEYDKTELEIRSMKQAWSSDTSIMSFEQLEAWVAQRRSEDKRSLWQKLYESPLVRVVQMIQNHSGSGKATVTTGPDAVKPEIREFECEVIRPSTFFV